MKKEFGSEYDKKLDDFAYNNAEKIFQFVSLDDGQVSKATRDLKKISKKNPEKLYHLERTGFNDYYLVNGKAMLFMKDRLIKVDGELKFGTPLTEIWDDVLPNDLHNEGGVSFKKGKKTEKLVRRAIELTTHKNDIVLDFFAGSGTTGAVATKLNRRFILVEQMEYINGITKRRLLNTVIGEKTAGISKDVNWQGGGSFIYTELMDLNNTYIKQIQDANTSTKLLDILETIKKYADLNYLVELEKLTNEPITIDEDTKETLSFDKLPLEKQRELLIDVMDINQLYVNYSEIDDSMYEVSEQDKAFNRSFYEEGDN